ncbi:MAG: hypothetical protein V7723_14000 [Sneathiella sp.]|uniref:hypothetical protein n=1 Tax=Sneathiella sp. TaxID=1964365 RepID=UPI00300350AC
MTNMGRAREPVVEREGEAVAVFRRTYIEGLQIDCLFACPNSLQAICSSPEESIVSGIHRMWLVFMNSCARFVTPVKWRCVDERSWSLSSFVLPKLQPLAWVSLAN